MPVTQFNMKWVEQAGLVKFDFLGLKTLTVLQTAVALVKRRGIDIDLAAIPLDDKNTYDLLARAEAVGIFQLESAGMRRALLDMRPDRFEDIIALVALYRPGPMANIPTYCARKHGMEQSDYIHPKLESILRETFGVIIYQEQVMQAAQILAGFTLGEADLLRRAMGKKIKKEMQAQRERFVSGAVERGVERYQADAIFDLLERFAEYGFNKSHAAAYALVAYQTAYMKANYPVEFLAATMTLDMGNTDKLAEFRAESERLGIAVDPPSINRSAVDFEVDGNTIIYALAALKGVGKQAVETIIAARGNREFADLADFAARINPRAVNKRVLESLAAAGAFDTFEKNRARVFAAVDVVLARAQRAHDTAAIGQSELFGGGAPREQIALPQVEPWLPAERLRREYEAIGFFLSGHPLDDYAAVLKKLRVQSWAEFARAVKAGATAGRVAATVVSRIERRTRTGSKMGIIGLSDPTGHFEAVIFSEGLAEHRDLLEPGNAVLLFLSAEVQGDEVRARIQSVDPLDSAAANLQKGLRVFLRDDTPLEAVAKRLETSSRSSHTNGDGEVSVVLLLQRGTEVEVKLPGRFKVSPQIAGAIKAVPGVVQVEAL
jgi:DNA polymerase-3 subunit alpha